MCLSGEYVSNMVPMDWTGSRWNTRNIQLISDMMFLLLLFLLDIYFRITETYS